MLRASRPRLTLLALATAAGLLRAAGGPPPLDRARWAELKRVESLRADQVASHLIARSSPLGLGMQDGLEAVSRITDEAGRTFVRFRQVHRGLPVFGSAVLGHVDAQGQPGAIQAAVFAGIQLADLPLMTDAEARAAALQAVETRGRASVSLQPIVFPTLHQDGLKLVRTPGTHELVVDERYSVGTRPKAEPFVRAYQALVTERTAHGLSAVHVILDAHTGEVLKKWDDREYAEGPAVGVGHSQYNGTVALSTLDQGDGTFKLVDVARPTKPWPTFGKPDWEDPFWGGVGTRTLALFPDFNVDHYVNRTNTWGDGQRFDGRDRLSVNGETAAVDAQYAIQATWDFFRNVFNRDGIDDLGSSAVMLVHVPDPRAPQYPWANASWTPSLFMMQVGDGAETGSLATLDVMAHEMSHGVNTFSALFGATGKPSEGAGLNEANSDIFGVLVKYYAYGGGKGRVIPETAPGVSFDIGGQLSPSGTPLRSLVKPSQDGISYDHWFDGIGQDDEHFTCGPGGRMFYFLSQGAGTDPTKPDYSPFLPGGMKGLGNDTAARIWYRTITTQVTDPSTGYREVREAAIAAAQEFGPTEVAAVKNAFAAVNVGGPDGGQAPVQVSFRRPEDRLFIVPFGQTPLPTPQVLNATDPSFTWSLGGLSVYVTQGGQLVDGTTFQSPFRRGIWPVRATSTQDPRRYAVGMVASFNLDADDDGEVDPCDLGALALSAFLTLDGKPYVVYPSADASGDGKVDTTDFSIFLQGFQNAFGR